jgi:prepilin-type N-terminal cleavage/methylation domain-containing protein
MVDQPRGFTLIELMVVLAVVGIATSLAIPSFRQIIQQLRIESERSELQSIFMLARSEAVKRSQRTWVSSSNAGWTGTITVFVDSNEDGVLQPTERVLATVAPRKEISVQAAPSISAGVGYTQTGAIFPTNSSLLLVAPNLDSLPGAHVGLICFGSNGRTNLNIPKNPTLTALSC